VVQQPNISPETTSFFREAALKDGHGLRGKISPEICLKHPQPCTKRREDSPILGAIKPATADKQSATILSEHIPPTNFERGKWRSKLQGHVQCTPKTFCLFCGEDKGHRTRTFHHTIHKQKEIASVTAQSSQPKKRCLVHLYTVHLIFHNTSNLNPRILGYISLRFQILRATL
jgi:hypothetical protein